MGKRAGLAGGAPLTAIGTAALFGGRYAEERVLVLGATGFVGRWVSQLLDEAGANVTRVARDPGAAAELAGETVLADLAVPGQATEVVGRVRPSIVFNLASYGVDPAERDDVLAAQVNGNLPGELCLALAGKGATGGSHGWPGQRLVHVGSGIEYGAAAGDLDESTPARPTTLYARSKLAGTRQVATLCPSLGVRGLTARPFTIYGPGEHHSRLLPSLLRAARSREVLALTAGDQRRDFTYVEDVAAGLLRLGLSEAPPGAVVNLATGRLTTVREFCRLAAGILGIPYDRLRFGALPVRAEEMVHVEVSLTRLRGLTGWIPTTDIAAGIVRTRDLRDRL